jgi:4-alpha-glucanotransferase
MDRAAGVLAPLFSLRRTGDWGVGEIPHVGPFCRWLASAGHHLLQLLPIVEMAPGERSPYAALSGFALDPIYVGLEEVEDFVAAGGEAALDTTARQALARAREQPGIDYDAVRTAKRAALLIAFRRFADGQGRTGSSRAGAFQRFREEERAWLPDYALFRALHEREGEQPWTAWSADLRSRLPAAVEQAGRSLDDAVRFHEYEQWIAAEQWTAARRTAAAAGVRLKGDLPFVVSTDSAEVWAHQDEFRLDASLGAPPDAFNADGQNWGLPVPSWDAMGARGFAWLRARAARTAALFDAVRLDHVVGFYRVYVIPPRAFVPDDEEAQLILGERLLGVLHDAARGTALVGEDLGVVPPFVRASLTRLGVPGYRVLRWEDDGGAFREPHDFPALSVATTGTHDTSSLATWWTDELDDGGRRAVAAVPSFAALRETGATFTPAVHAALLDGLYGAGSDLVVLPFADAYGGRERINVPATVGPENWGYRMPWTVDALAGAAGREVMDRLAGLATRHGR